MKPSTVPGTPIFKTPHPWSTGTDTGAVQKSLLAVQANTKTSSISSTSHTTPRTSRFACEWHFFATAYGKSACDGIGGTVKRAMARESSRRLYADQIMSALAMFSFLMEKFETTIQFLLVEKEEVRKTSARLNARFSVARTIAGTRQFHQFVPIDRPTEGSWSVTWTRENSPH